MKNTIINTDLHTYLIKFSFQATTGQFITQGAGLMEVLKQYDKNGVKYIKQFDPAKAKFIQVSKKDLLNRFTFDTEVYLYLQNHYYFK